MMRIGIDLGGTKIEVIAIDDGGRELFRRRIPTPAGDYEGTVRAIVSLVETAESELRVQGSRVGVGTPGIISPATGVMKNSNSTCLIGRPLDRDLAQALKREVRLANDANCFALSEATDGAAAGEAVVFGVILGTGVGGGVVVDGKVLFGRNGITGEWGHNPLPWPREDERPGPACYCGRSNCVESFLSGPALARDHGGTRGEVLTPTEIVKAASAGDARAAATLARYEERLARALASVINILDPDVIVLGGGVSNVGRLYESVPKLWGKYVFSDEVATRLVRNKHGDSSGVRGAAWLWGR